jgi:hypothetical protein
MKRDRFIDIYENPAVTQAHKSAALRLLVNPILLVVYRNPMSSLSATWLFKKRERTLWSAEVG